MARPQLRVTVCQLSILNPGLENDRDSTQLLSQTSCHDFTQFLQEIIDM